MFGKKKEEEFKLPDLRDMMEEDSPPEEEEIPDILEPVVGYRTWAFSAEGLLLSHHYNWAWPAKQKLTGYCHCGMISRSSEKRCPVENHNCGIHVGLTENEMMISQAPFVWGRVACWGKVIEHEKGYRGEFAYPLNLNVVNFSSHPEISAFSEDSLKIAIKLLSMNYGVPVRLSSMEEIYEIKALKAADVPVPEEVRELISH